MRQLSMFEPQVGTAQAESSDEADAAMPAAGGSERATAQPTTITASPPPEFVPGGAPPTREPEAQARQHRVKIWGWKGDGSVFHREGVTRYDVLEPDPGSALPTHRCQCGGRVFVSRAGVFAPRSERDWTCIVCHPPCPESTVAVYELPKEREDVDESTAE